MTKRNRYIIISASILLLAIGSIFYIRWYLSFRQFEACVMSKFDDNSFLLRLNIPADTLDFGSTYIVRLNKTKFISHDSSINSLGDLSIGSVINITIKDLVTSCETASPSIPRIETAIKIEAYGLYNSELFQKGIEELRDLGYNYVDGRIEVRSKEEMHKPR